MKAQKATWKIAIVIPWFGKLLKGGAEQQAWQIATNLRKTGCQVEVLTTCSESFLSSWSKNFYRPGVYLEDHITVRRFGLSRRRSSPFNRVVSKLLAIPKHSFLPGVCPISSDEEEIYWKENINSPSLLEYIEHNSHKYDFFIFLPYLFPCSVDGIEIAGKKSLLQPCLHDECYAYLRRTMDSIYRSQALLFNSRGEYLLAKNLYGSWIESKSFVVGEGIEISIDINQYKPEFPVPGSYILCLGRKCPEKNTHSLVSSFDAFTKSCPSSKLHLVLAGPGDIDLPNNQKIIDFGLVSPRFKSYLLSNCRALVNPSYNESFSRVVFEAWSFKKPVVVNRECLAMAAALEDSGFAGWWASNQEEFQEVFSILDSDETANKIKGKGSLGFEYSSKIAVWSKVVEKYLVCFASLYQKRRTNRDNKKQLLVLAQGASQELLIDLREFFEAIRHFLCDRIDIIYQGKINSLLKVGISKKNIKDIEKIDFCLVYGIIWFGNRSWPKAWDLCSSATKAFFYQRTTYGLVDIVQKMNEKDSIDFQMKNREDTSYNLPFLFSHKLIQKDGYSFREFERLNGREVNILLLNNQSLNRNATAPQFAIAQNINSITGVKIKFLVPSDSYSLDKGLKCDYVKVKKFNMKGDPPVIPSAVLNVSDCLLSFGPVVIGNWNLARASSHGLPVVLVDCDNRSGLDDYLSISTHSWTAERIASTIILACSKSPTRSYLCDLNSKVVKKNIPGFFQTNLAKTLLNAWEQGVDQR